MFYLFKHYYRTNGMNDIFVAKAILLAWIYTTIRILVANTIALLLLVIAMKFAVVLMTSDILKFQPS